MTVWQLFCALHFADDLVVLGPKCHSTECLQPVAATVHWVTGPIRCCERCTAKWRQVADALGMVLHVEQRSDYVPPGLSASQKRYALIELY